MLATDASRPAGAGCRNSGRLTLSAKFLNHCMQERA
jgi:hypothetical protein